MMATGTGPCRIDSPSSWHIALAGERNLASEIGFSSSILLHAHLLLTPEAESDQIAHDSKLSLKDLFFLRYASVHKQHCEEIDETDSIQTYDATTDPNVESVGDLLYSSPSDLDHNKWSHRCRLYENAGDSSRQNEDFHLSRKLPPYI